MSSDFARCGMLNGKPLPLVIEPRTDRRVDALIEWLQAENDWVHHRMIEHGAILLRGFDVSEASQFEAISRAISPDVRSDFVGTPGKCLSGTDHVYLASEGLTEYPISQHCELSYLPEPPRQVFFCCLAPPTDGHGETPLADNRKVWQSLHPDVRDRFTRRGIRVVRNMIGPGSGFRLWTQFRWDHYFATTDRAEVEAQCKRAGFDFEWTRDDGLRVSFRQPVTRDHPVTGERAWCNQLLSDNVKSAPHEFRRIYRFRPSLRLFLRWQFVAATAALKMCSPTSMLMAHCTHEDGSPIRREDEQAVRDAVWANLAWFEWRAGDVVAVDNRATSHGRFPSWGTRTIVSCMA